MKMHIKEFAKLTGVSVRTLHYYDEIGLLKPAFIDHNNNYRFYSEASLERMQEILFYRELDFPLKSIITILSSPDYDKKKALSEQKRLLILKKERLERLILALDNADKGVIDMNTFDNSKFENERKKYQQEAKEKWGNTAEYKDFEKRNKNSLELTDGLNSFIAEFAKLKKDGFSPESPQVQKLVSDYHAFINENCYNCTDEILLSLGQMYICDERFTKNIDSFGKGTALFMKDSITVYTDIRKRS